MHKEQEHFKDLAIILTWPEATIRGDEKWMMFFKKIGLVKNLNFKVGHTGIVIIKRQTGEMQFYDFGRYIAPRGYGRARSKYSDPNLEITLKAAISNDNIKNLPEIIEHFEELKSAMYGEGILYFSIVHGINFEQAETYGDDCVRQGTFPYGAVARNNNNCSRFITRMLIRSSKKYTWRHSINFPESIKASPISNVVNAVNDRMIYSYTPEQGLKHFRMNRWQSFGFLCKKLGDNISQQKAALLPDDIIIGQMNFKSKPITIPKDAFYLGGVGDGAWFTVQQAPDQKVLVKRFTSKGTLEYAALGESMEPIDFTKPFNVVYDSHLLHTHITQEGRKIRINHTQKLSNEEYQYKDLKELYA
ncbi:DUF6695 family protein [Sphingobacterium sp. JB170]|uniref:DUF6695 family protein n=1 Tax=Sphingobacterium sp. JB170 TaxID=1434842 RepID=UPI00097F5FEE|nr:DUF6695 family protein [Sphingobacterium sp. JB170]SJN42513.1 hypothetical protein FM107_11655 [Sphingobacterium sp. JB170]